MLFKLFASIAVALALAGSMLALHRVSRGVIPRSMILVAAAFGIIGYHVFDEYNWHSRKLAGFAEAKGNYVVVAEYQSRAFFRPWSYLKAPILRLDVVNLDTNKSIEGYPDYFENFIGASFQSGEVKQSLFVFDCKNARFSIKGDDIAKLPWADMSERMREALCN